MRGQTDSPPSARNPPAPTAMSAGLCCCYAPDRFASRHRPRHKVSPSPAVVEFEHEGRDVEGVRAVRDAARGRCPARIDLGHAVKGEAGDSGCALPRAREPGTWRLELAAYNERGREPARQGGSGRSSHRSGRPKTPACQRETTSRPRSRSPKPPPPRTEAGHRRPRRKARWANCGASLSATTSHSDTMTTIRARSCSARIALAVAVVAVLAGVAARRPARMSSSSPMPRTPIPCESRRSMREAAACPPSRSSSSKACPPRARDDYRAGLQLGIQAPIARWLARNAAFDRILYIVLTKGIPLRVMGTAGRNGSTASVDSELALLYRTMYRREGRGHPGPQTNPYFLGTRPIERGGAIQPQGSRHLSGDAARWLHGRRRDGTDRARAIARQPMGGSCST